MQVQLLLERLSRRYRSVHGYHLWVPAGRDWTNLDELLWLFACYRVRAAQAGLHAL